MKENKLALLAMAVASASVVSPTFAQSGDSGSFALEEVVVTAQRKAESLQDAAIPISVATADDLVRAGVENASALNNVAPALNVVKGGGSSQSLFIRGVGNITPQRFLDQAIAMNLDGVYVGRSSGSTSSFLDVERIEVLKGPQGTLYGRNATGGAVNILPVKPILGETSGFLRGGVGNYEAMELSGAVNLAVSDSTALRFSVATSENEGYNDDGTDQTDDIAFRAQILSELGDSVEARLAVDYSENNGDGRGLIAEGTWIPNGSGAANIDGYTYIAFPDAVSDIRGGLNRDEVTGFFSSLPPAPGIPVLTAPGATLIDGFERPYQDNQFWGVNGEIKFSFNAGELVVLPAYRKTEIDSNHNGPGFRAAIGTEESDQISLEARFSGATDNFEYLLGAFYFEESIESRDAINQFSLFADQQVEQDTDSTALFARGTLNITDNARVVVGMRYTEDTREFTGQTDVLQSVCTNLLLPPVVPAPVPFCAGGPNIPAAATLDSAIAAINAAALNDPTLLPATGQLPPVIQGIPYGVQGNLLFSVVNAVDSDLKEDELTYRLAFEYDAGDDNLLYASFENGFRAGGFNLAAGRETFAPEFIDAYTIGSKNRFLNNRLQLNVEAFFWDYEDQQQSIFGVDENNTLTLFVENVGNVEIYGLDTEVLFQAAEKTLLKANIQYLESELKEFVYEDGSAGGLPAISGCEATFNRAITPPGVIYDLDCSGKEGLFSPDWAINVGIAQGVDLGDLELSLNADVRYRGEQETALTYLPTSRDDARTTVDLSATLRPADGNWWAMVYGNNVTDEESLTQQLTSTTTGNLSAASYAAPATYGLRFGLDF